MAKIIIMILWSFLGVLILLFFIYKEQKKKGGILKSFERNIGVKLSPSIKSYKGKYGRYELELMLWEGYRKEVIVKLKFKKDISVIFTNQPDRDISIGFFSKGKFFRKKLKLPMEGIKIGAFTYNETEGKKFLYSNQNIIEDINHFAEIAESYGCTFILKPGEFELKFPDLRLINKEIIDACIKIIDKL